MLAAAGRPASWRFALTDFDGDPVTPSASPTVTIANASGSVVVDGEVASSVEDDGAYLFTLPDAVVGTLGQYAARADFTIGANAGQVRDVVDVVADVLFDVGDMRDFDSKTYGPASASARYPGWRIRRARDAATDYLERAAEVAFATRRRRVTLPGTGLQRLLLPDVDVTSVVSVLVDGTTLDETELAALHLDGEVGLLVRPDQPWPGRWTDVVVEYEHGYPTPPGPSRRAAMLIADEYLRSNALPARATVQNTQLGDFRIGTANVDRGHETGIPEVDAVIALYGRRRPRLGGRR